MHRFELRFALLAVVGLLIAQLGAQSHAYSHDAVPASTQGVAAIGHDPCSDCLAFAPLLSGGLAPALVPFVLPLGGADAHRAAPAARAGRPATLAFRSRAPPYTLLLTH